MTGEQLRTLRESRKLTREGLAEYLGDCSQSTVNKWERGINPVPGWVADKMLSDVKVSLPIADLAELLYQAKEEDLDLEQVLSEAIRDYIHKHSKKIAKADVALMAFTDDPAEYKAKPKGSGNAKSA